MNTYIPSGRYIFQHRGYPLSEEESLKDLSQVVSQYKNRKVSDKLQHVCDKTPDKLFEVFLSSKGKTYNTSYIDRFGLSLIPIIVKIKDYYNRPRPFETAQKLGLDISFDDLETAKSPSYPSGHTIQAYVVALKLSEQFPEFEEELLSIAEIISQSRIDRGVHFPTDIEYGREVAYDLYDQIKEGLGGETPRFKLVYDENYY